MITVKKKVVIIKGETFYKCLLYDLDYSGYNRPLRAAVYPLSSYFKLQYQAVISNFRNGCLW